MGNTLESGGKPHLRGVGNLRFLLQIEVADGSLRGPEGTPVSDLAERVQRVRLLLETLNDPYPQPRTSLRPDSGPAASHYIPCETCKRSGWIRRRREPVLCLACDGVGWRRRQHGELEWDAYVELPVSEAVSLPVGTAPRRPVLAAGEESPYQWERLREAYDRRGSYREVRQRLDELGTVAPRRHRLIRIVLVEQQPRQLDDLDRLDLDLGVVTITLRMRSIRVPPWLMEHERTTTNASVVELAADGFKPGAIASRLGLSREQVKRTLRKQRQRSRIGGSDGPAGLVPNLGMGVALP